MKIIRATTLVHLDAIALMQIICLPHDTPLRMSSGKWWIAIDEHGVPQGFASVHGGQQFSDCAYLSRAGVMPEAWGKGLQRRLIRARVAYARKAGFRWAITDTTCNPRSANNLIACGFRTWAPHNPWALDYSTYWSKKL